MKLKHFFSCKKTTVRPLISNVYSYIRSTSTFTPECLDLYWKDQDFFHHLYCHSENKRLVNWARIVRTFHESGGDVNYNDLSRAELVATLNCLGDVLTPDLMREVIANGFTFEGKDLHTIGSLGHVGASAVRHNIPHKIDVMEILNRDFGWIHVVHERAIIYHVFGINGHAEDFSTFFMSFRTTAALVKMHYQYGSTRMKNIWMTFPKRVKDSMRAEVVEFMDKKLNN